jgi:hypothetical protein
MTEIWKDVVGYDGYYVVSNKGNIKGIERYVKSRNTYKYVPPITLKQFYFRGYLRCMFSKYGKHKQMFSHRVVAIAFISNPENKLEINHINGIKDDNRVENIEWCTRKENMQHAVRTGLHKGTSHVGESNGKSKLSIQDVLDIRALLETMSQKEIAIIYNVSASNIWKIKHKIRWKHI